ncbi:hypothetical protein BDV59DRAFT_189864 [Aspergillus ambiguus]|uniref:uncharacterized protein n=1 Tax=Aspergillus ambiguus TaxID=176160 RepID=UPI003CCD62BC
MNGASLILFHASSSALSSICRQPLILVPTTSPRTLLYRLLGLSRYVTVCSPACGTDFAVISLQPHHLNQSLSTCLAAVYQSLPLAGRDRELIFGSSPVES